MSEKSYTLTYSGTNDQGNDYVCFVDGDGKPGYSYSNLNGSAYSKYPDGATAYVNPTGKIYSTPASGDGGINIDSSESAPEVDGITDFASGGGTSDSDTKE